MELSDFTGQPCKSSMAYEFLPKRKGAVDLVEIAEKLKLANVEIEVETPILLMLKVSGKKISFFKSGKILVKETKDAGEAREAAEELIKAINFNQ